MLIYNQPPLLITHLNDVKFGRQTYNKQVYVTSCSAFIHSLVTYHKYQIQWVKSPKRMSADATLVYSCQSIDVKSNETPQSTLQSLMRTENLTILYYI